MITSEEADLIWTILELIFALIMLGTFTGAVFLEKKRRNLAIVTGIFGGLLLFVMVMALASPYLFSK